MTQPTVRTPVPLRTIDCRLCGSLRVMGIRTCGRDCLRGIDPRLPSFLGVAPWVVYGWVTLP